MLARKPPDASAKDQSLLRDLKEQHGKNRHHLYKRWWASILFLRNIQWIVWDQYAKRYRNRKLAPSVPTPTTNLFRSTLDTVKSAIAQHDPRFLGTPTRDDPKAIAAASSADTQLAVILQEGKFRKSRRRMLDWLMPTGNAFIEPVWDDSEETGQDTIPYEECTDCLSSFPPGQISKEDPVCPTCGSSMLTDSKTLSVVVPRGSINFRTVSPLEVYMNGAVEEKEDQPHALFVQTFPTESVEMTYDVSLDDDNSDAMTGTNLREQISSIGSGSGLTGSMPGVGDRKHQTTVMRAFIKHHKDYPDGAYIVMTAGGKLLEKKTPYPWRRKGTGRKFYPWVHFRFGTEGGDAWGYSPADDLVPKQYQLNKAESMLMMHMGRMANAVWLIPSNTNPTRVTGDMGLQIEYTAIGGAAPQRVQGAEAPNSLVKYIGDIRQAFDELSGAFAAVRGRAVGSRTPVGTTQLLADRGFGRWATVFDNLEEGYEELAKNALEIWRQNAKSPRVRAVKNAIGGWTFQEFEAADWDDGVDIAVEAGSARPRTQQEKIQTYQGFVSIGLLDPTDHAQRVKILEDTGMLNMLPGAEEDTKQAYKENADFMAWATNVAKTVGTMDLADPVAVEEVTSMLSTVPITVNPVVDDHAIHFLTFRRLALTDEYKALPDIIQKVGWDHMLQHQMDIGKNTIGKIPMLAAPPQSGSGGGKGGGGAVPQTGSGVQ